MATYDPYEAALELREQLTSEKRRVGFLFGAGTSMAVGLPGIDQLTTMVSDALDVPCKNQFDKICDEISESANIERVLGRVRMYRELMCGGKECSYADLESEDAARELDKRICQAIAKCVRIEKSDDSSPHYTFAKWIRALYSDRAWPVEIFTTNYDVFIEEAFDRLGVPYFDGFVGSVEPFFAPESVEAEPGSTADYLYPPRGWTRLSKLHGSINWCARRSSDTDTIHRLSGLAGEDEELVIYPSHEKYVESRKLPFITFQDRLRRFAASGEGLLIVCGFAFGDQHLNDILIQGLRSNPRLAVTALVYGNADASGKRVLPLSLIKHAERFANLTLYGPDKAVMGGIAGDWRDPNRKPEGASTWPFWDAGNRIFTLGDFNSFARFLEEFMGFRTSALEARSNTPAAGPLAAAKSEATPE